jgi:hypothetical protein
MNTLKTNNEYGNWLESLKEKIKQSQIKASLSVNSELIQLYWNLGLQIIEKSNNDWFERLQVVSFAELQEMRRIKSK